MIDSDVREQSLAEDMRLLRRYVEAGDADAFRLVARRYLDFVYTVCVRELRNPQAAEDATQETFIALAKQARRLRPGTVLPAWLFTVALARCREALRRETRRRRLSTSPSPPRPSSEPGLDLQLALASLPPPDREVVILRVLMEYSHAEVARTIGVSEDAARMRADRALKRLRERAGAALILAWPMERATIEPSQLRLPSRPLPSRPLPRWQWTWIAGGGLLIAATPWLASASLAAAGGSKQAAGFLFRSGVVATDLSSSGLIPMHAKVTILEGGKVGFTGETWRNKDVIRWRQPFAGTTIEAEIRDGVLRSLVTGAKIGPSEGGIVIAGPDRRIVQTDAFEAALFQLPVYIHSRSPLPVMALPSPGGKDPRKVEANGRTYQVWFDRAHQGRASKVDYRFDEHHFVTSVVRWQTVGGVVLPAKLTMQSWYRDRKGLTRQIVLSDVSFGDSAPKPPPLPKPEHGALVMDERRKVIYRVDENWKRISAEQSVKNGDIGSDGRQL